MSERNVYIFMPTYSGTPRSIETVHCLMDVDRGLERMGWGSHWKYTVGDSLVFRSRNMALADFYLRKEFTDLVMLDDDLWWETDAVLRLLSHPVDFVAGAYPKKQKRLEYVCKRVPGAEPDVAGLVEVLRVGTGFLRLTRACVDSMIERYPELAYRDTLVEGGKAWALFFNNLWPDEEDPDPEGLNELWGEDFSFCKRWRDMGGKIYVDTLLRFRHFGRPTAYEGCYAEHLPGIIETLQSQSAA